MKDAIGTNVLFAVYYSSVISWYIEEFGIQKVNDWAQATIYPSCLGGGRKMKTEKHLVYRITDETEFRLIRFLRKTKSAKVPNGKKLHQSLLIQYSNTLCSKSHKISK